MSKKLLISSFLLMSFGAYAHDFEAVGTRAVHLNLDPAHHANAATHKAAAENDVVEVIEFKLTEAEKQMLRDRLDEKPQKIVNKGAALLPAKRSLGMNGVPVLDQGRHGSCVTFAVAGAYDAALGHGDYLSELCNLTLGNYLHNHYGQPSGWDGSTGSIVLAQMDQYGYWTISEQKKYKCGGLKDYPTSDHNQRGKDMTPADYAKHSHNLGQVNWQNLASGNDVDLVKQSLAAGHRVVFGVLLDTSVGHVGATATYHKSNDSWVMTSEIKDHLKKGQIHSGHELVITGYSDTMKIGNHKGFFTLRNSWSNRAGDNGNYYMSYEYYHIMTHAAQQIMSPGDK